MRHVPDARGPKRFHVVWRPIAARHGATLMVICTDLAEPHIYAADAPDGLMAQILRGEAPDWLEPVEIGAPPALRVWRIRS